MLKNYLVLFLALATNEKGRKTAFVMGLSLFVEHACHGLIAKHRWRVSFGDGCGGDGCEN